MIRWDPGAGHHGEGSPLEFAPAPPDGCEWTFPRYPEALTHLQAALALKKSEGLEQYASRVRRAADRMQDKQK